MVGELGMVSYSSGYGQVPSCCEHGNDPFEFRRVWGISYLPKEILLYSSVEWLKEYYVSYDD
jgi:hypothetical protein